MIAEQHNDVATPDHAAAWLVSLFVATLAIWVGATAFFSTGVLPALFLNLEPSDAGRIAALLFPVYFRAGLVAGVVASVAAVMLARGGGRRWKVVVVMLVVMTCAEAWQALVVLPEIARIRGVDAEIARFQQLHELSVRLNGVVLAGGLALLAAGGLLFSRRRGQS